jgi:hypothetical protein
MEPLINELVNGLKVVGGVKAIVLGGSRADDTHRPDLDFDIGIYYQDQNEFDLEQIKTFSNTINDTFTPTVTAVGEWGRWVNGGAWLTIRGQKVDFLYRDLIFVRQIIQDCNKGLRQADFYQQPPFGFHSYIYCGEISICRVLFDPENLISKLKKEVQEYPPALKKTIVRDFLWDAEFSLLHCRKSARRGEVLIMAGCLSKIASDLVQVLYALNEIFFISEKRLYKQEKVLPLKPDNFFERLNRVLSKIGNSAIEMADTLLVVESLFDDFVKLAGDLYHPKFKY